jgi:hypothetical protein
LTAEQVAGGILKGRPLILNYFNAYHNLWTAAQKGYHNYAADLITNIFLASARGLTPSHNVFFALIMDLVAWVFYPLLSYNIEL